MSFERKASNPQETAGQSGPGSMPSLGNETGQPLLASFLNLRSYTYVSRTPGHPNLIVMDEVNKVVRDPARAERRVINMLATGRSSGGQIEMPRIPVTGISSQTGERPRPQATPKTPQRRTI